MPLLDLPDCRQESAHDCGPVAVRCVLSWYRIEGLPLPLASPLDGTHPATMETHLREGCRLHVVSGSIDFPDVRHFCDTGRPPILLATWPGESSHWLVARGVSRGRLYYHCPADGRESMRLAEFAPLWTANDGKRSKAFVRWSLTAWPLVG